MAAAEADAETIRLQGEGEAQAIRARGEAKAWKQYGQAAMIDKLLTSLPEVAAAVSQPLAQTDRIVMIGGGNGGIGASQLTGDVTRVVSQLPEVIESLTGIDILGTLKNLPRVVTTDGANTETAKVQRSGEAKESSES